MLGHLWRFILVACGALILAAPVGQARPAAATAATAAPRVGFYNCYARTYPITYIVSIQLRQGGRYSHGFADRTSRKFKSIVGSGTYRVAGTRITFAGGPMRKLYGVTATSAKFAVWASGQKVYSYYCYGKF
jgi:hypothetical protein